MGVGPVGSPGTGVARTLSGNGEMGDTGAVGGVSRHASKSNAISIAHRANFNHCVLFIFCVMSLVSFPHHGTLLANKGQGTRE
jgi:hypothetical protein